ncbi:MAG: Gfo/Idh/MocA family oxidoreductase [Gemmataceae bacterium]|nr:Gfo/Idh/MocA family oxidoreductase [Gemmataceae bacterium]
MEKTRVALAGCGKVGKIHCQALREIGESELVALCDSDLNRAGAFANEFGGKPFTSLAQALKEARPDVLLIATPHPLHRAPAVEALAAGVAVLVEKPLAASLEDCNAMLMAAKSSGATLGVISQRRFFEPVQRMKQAIDAGKIGKPILGHFIMYSWRSLEYYRSDPWRGKWDTEGGGVLVNQSPHQLDLLRWFLGPVAEVQGYYSNLNHPGVEVEDTAVASLKFANGALGSILASVSQKPGIHTKIHVHGDNGASIGVETDRGSTFIAGMSSIAEPPLTEFWSVPGEEHLLSAFQEEDRQVFARVDATVHYHAVQIREFIQAVREKRPPLVSAEDGRASVELFTAIYRSSREGRAIKLPL